MTLLSRFRRALRTLGRLHASLLHVQRHYPVTPPAAAAFMASYRRQGAGGGGAPMWVDGRGGGDLGAVR
jgi:hypothetical protein